MREPLLPYPSDRFAGELEVGIAYDALTRYLTEPCELVGAFLGGSLVAGLGHPSSDIDVYALVRGCDSLVGRSVSIGRHRVEIKPTGLAELVHTAELGEEYLSTASDRSQIAMPDKTLKRVVELYLSRDLVGCDEVRAARERISRDVLKKILLSRHALAAAGAADDAYGAIQCGDWTTALDCSSTAVRAAGEVCLAAVGDFYVGAKFLWRRLARNKCTERAGADGWHLVSHSTGRLERSDVEKAVGSRVLFANALVSCCLLLGWSRDLDELPEEDMAGSLGRTRGRGFWRSPFFGMVRFRDGIGLAGPIDAFELDAFTARVWSLADGCGVQFVAEKIVSETGSDPCTVAGLVSEAFERLEALGLVSEGGPGFSGSTAGSVAG